MTSRLMIVLVIIVLGRASFAQTKVNRIDSLLGALYEKGKLNGNVLVAEKGKIIYLKSFGIANEATGGKLNENTIFELASCSKQFTAMAIMILKEQGKLNLDDPMAKYLPKLAFYDKITIRNLLNHTGGLQDYLSIMDTVFDKHQIAVNEDIINIFAKLKPALEFTPGTQFKYSNTGYALLAFIIEKASGESYASFLKKRIFEPLHMQHTLVYNRRLHPKKVDNYAFGYIYSKYLGKYLLPDSIEKAKVVYWLDGVVGDGTVNSTVLDLLKWDRALYTNMLLSKKDMQQIFAPAKLIDGTLTKYGFGWKIEQHSDYGKIVRHSGGWPGYKSDIERHTDYDKTIIVLQNHYDTAEPTKAIRSILYDQPITLP
ncbi:serine hydrolase [Mucilaginibacter galii]|uniref:Penicillin-binding protein 4 n=1 Tax=Mucilaginibacter galii TaxID=2005073 RepID=A0A917JAD7_9SPHI|nr:serine hydrolase domain-containing protein [Mucilaginibacter galii]GGI52105.1 penicillin-binding protein 4* [Mucilaginibacter galii]